MANELRIEMRKVISESLQEGLKAVAHPAAYEAHQAIYLLPQDKWNDVLNTVVDDTWQFLSQQGRIKKISE